MRSIYIPLLSIILFCCAGPEATEEGELIDGKADVFGEGETVEVIITDPYCDVCTSEDKDIVRARSEIRARVVELIGQATETIDIAQFTFSDSEIKEALLEAHRNGVQIRLAMNSAQDRDGSVARELLDAGIDVRFIAGRPAGDRFGLMHAKFMIVDSGVLVTGSNNWSSTGISINDENTIVITGSSSTPIIAGFACDFEAIWNSDPDSAAACNDDGLIFTPSGDAVRLIRDSIRGAEESIDVLMHHLTFDDHVRDLAQAAERGVRVRVIVNAADREEHRGSRWDRLIAAGGEIRYKQTNGDLYQIMHHKLVIIDDRILINGSGNWSGSAFFNNFENFVRYTDSRVVRPFRETFARLWTWSLTGESLDMGRSAAEQHAETNAVYLGNLHSHFDAVDGDQMLDDGRAERIDEQGVVYAVDVGDTVPEAARFAFEYARDQGGMDFLGLSPHTMDFAPADSPTQANMTEEGYGQMRAVAGAVTDESGGEFLAIPSMEWSTNGSGNHVNILGISRIANTERGRFDLLYQDFLPALEATGDQPILMFNHPRTFRIYQEALDGNWDQIFGVNLLDIPQSSQRRKKFNDYGLDDFAPLSEVHQSWIDGEAMPDEAIVAETLSNIWNLTQPYVRLMEVTPGRGSELGGEDFYNPSLSIEEDGTMSRFVRVHTDWDYYLLNGFRLAPAASHDNHMANWGTGHSSRTGIAADELTLEGLLEAIDARCVYASEDQNLILRFYAENRIPMGGTHTTPHGSVSTTAYIEDPDYSGPFEIVVYRGRVGDAQTEQVDTFTLNEGGSISPILEVPEPGEYFFYLEVFEPEPNRMAWTAPIWVERI